jgi:hypothetical protein
MVKTLYSEQLQPLVVVRVAPKLIQLPSTHTRAILVQVGLVVVEVTVHPLVIHLLVPVLLVREMLVVKDIAQILL